MQVTGICTEVSERGEWTTFHIDVGREHPVKLATKKAEMVELGRAASRSGQEMTWTYTEKDGNPNPHQPGTFYKNRYLEGVAPRDARSESAEQEDGQPTASGMTKDEWARKDSAIHKMACIKTAAAALTHTMPSDPTYDDLKKFSERVSTLAVWWHATVIAERDDPTGIDIPFSDDA